MALTGMSSDFDLDDHGILRDSFASDFHVDDDGILHDDLDLFKHAVSTAGHGTDSGFGGDKQSSTSTLQHFHASFDEDLAPIGDESINISDFEASRDDLDSVEGELDGDKRSRPHRGYRGGAKELETPGSTLERPFDAGNESYTASVSKKPGQRTHHGAEDEEQDLFSEEYYQQLRELGVLVDGADFSRDESQNEFEALESHLSRDHLDYDDDNRDLIGEYLQEEYEREQAEAEEEGEVSGRKGRGGQSHHAGPNSRASSAPTISGQSFPEISPEDADMMYSESQQTGDDDEMFLINNHLLPGSSRIQAQKLPVTPTGPGSRPNSRGSHARRSRNLEGRQNAHSRRSPSPAGSVASQDQEDFHRSRSENNTPYKGRPDSVASHASAASESARPLSGASSPGKSSLPKAHSQESFFEHDKQQNKSGEKLPKRMLPTPSTPETNQSFRVKSKSKSVSNIANKSAPVKPTHMSISEITRITMDEAGDVDGGMPGPAGDGSADKSEGELTTQLKQESSKRKQATELVQQLQKEYDSLLSKYALAELTIDQMRLGARITLHADSPTPSSVPSVMSQGGGGHKAQMMQLPQQSAQRAVVGQFSAGAGDGQSLGAAQVQTSDAHSQSASQSQKPFAVHGASEAGGQGAVYESEDRVSSKKPVAAETMKLNIQTQATALNDRLDQFHTLMENRQLTLEEQEKAFENIRTDHEKLRRSYLQAKEDYNVLRRSGASLPDSDFDSNKELEGQLFRLGMKFDEVHEHVDSNLKQQTTRRQPFQTSRLAEDQAAEDNDEGVEGDQPDGATAAAGAEGSEFEQRAEYLHEGYRALMDRYRRLKQMAPTPELEKETDNLVRKLKDICNEMPDMFRLPPELQERWERLHRRDQRRSPLPPGGEEGAVGGLAPGEHGALSSMPPSPKVHGSPLVGDHSISPYLSSRQGGRESHMDDSFRRTPSSLSGSRSSLISPMDHNSSTAVLRSSATPSPQDRDGRTSPSSLDGAAAPRDRDNYDPRINRPRRHQHDFRNPKLGKMADRGSYSSLPDSGISDQETRDRRPDDALAHLPGPGKMKQMTNQRGENDMDSGFIGSVVSTEGAQNPPRGWEPEGPLRLRDRQSGDRNQNRSRLDSSASSSTVASVQREPGSDRRSRKGKPPTGLSSSTGRRRDSIDRSYDGELDESTISDTREKVVRQRDVRPKQPPGQEGGAAVGAAGKRHQQQQAGRRGGEETSLQSQSTRSTRSQSRSTQEDETLEDVSDAEMTDVSTPRHVESLEDTHSQQSSTQQTPQAPRTPHRPPTPHRPATPQRPPTPYHAEEEATAADEAHQQEAAPAEETRMQSRRGSDDKVVQKRSQQQQRRSRSPAPAPTEHQQRPQSRGEPTTDLYHTRPRRERSRERSRDRDSVISTESSRPGSRYSRRSSEVSERIRGEDRGVGSDIEIRSDVTRASSANSARLRALQDEIEKLKVGVKQAHDKASERPEPSQPPPPPQHEGPEYYDPFDDPYGFMRMPRRRANSFSGGRVREFDEWYWTLPNERRNDDGDIPLGYAAADSYNRHHRDKTPEAARQRLRRRNERRKRGEETHAALLDGGVVNAGEAEVMVGVGAGPQLHSAPPPPPLTPGTATMPQGVSPAQVRRPHISDPQALYNYYLPSRQGAPQAYQAPSTSANPYRQHTTPLSASQPNLAATLAGVQPATYQYQTQQKRPWYTIRRSQWPASSTSGQYYPTKGYQRNVYQQQQQQQQPPQQVAGYYSSYPGSGPTTSVQGAVGYRTELCPLCGGAGAHIHEEDVEPVYGYTAQDFATQPGRYSYRRRRRHERHGRTRQRSRSLPRARHYTPERSSSRSRYLVREFVDSDSDDSDLELNRRHRRSRSLSRSRGHSETRHSARSSSRRRGRRYHRKTDTCDSDDDVDLNESLVLSEDINRLTKRMIGTVRGELKRHKNSKEFGSSYW